MRKTRLMSIRNLHLALGVAGVVAFLVTGQYMDRRLDHLRGMSDGPRLLHRSAHIYLLFSALLNLVLGLYWAPSPRVLGRRLQIVGCVLIAVGPALFVLAFLREPWMASETWPIRPYARPAIYASLVGVLLQLAGMMRARAL